MFEYYWIQITTFSGSCSEEELTVWVSDNGCSTDYVNYAGNIRYLEQRNNDEVVKQHVELGYAKQRNCVTCNVYGNFYTN